MSVKRYTGQEIKPGQFVNLQTMMRIGFASHPAKVVSVKKVSIVVQEASTYKGFVEFSSERIRRTKNVEFVCDTYEEAEAARKASWEFTDAEFAIEREQKKAMNMRKDAAINALLAAHQSDDQQT